MNYCSFPLFLTLFFTILYISPVLGQGNWSGTMPDAQEMAQKKTQWMADSLGLSEAQKAKVQEVNQTFATTWEAQQKEHDTGDFQATRERMMAHHQAQDDALRKYLTAAQWERYLLVKESMAPKRKRTPRGE